MKALCVILLLVALASATFAQQQYTPVRPCLLTSCNDTTVPNNRYYFFDSTFLTTSNQNLFLGANSFQSFRASIFFTFASAPIPNASPFYALFYIAGSTGCTGPANDDDLFTTTNPPTLPAQSNSAQINVSQSSVEFLIQNTDNSQTQVLFTNRIPPLSMAEVLQLPLAETLNPSLYTITLLSFKNGQVTGNNVRTSGGTCNPILPSSSSSESSSSQSSAGQGSSSFSESSSQGSAGQGSSTFSESSSSQSNAGQGSSSSSESLSSSFSESSSQSSAGQESSSVSESSSSQGSVGQGMSSSSESSSQSGAGQESSSFSESSSQGNAGQDSSSSQSNAGQGSSSSSESSSQGNAGQGSSSLTESSSSQSNGGPGTSSSQGTDGQGSSSVSSFDSSSSDNLPPRPSTKPFPPGCPINGLKWPIPYYWGAGVFYGIHNAFGLSLNEDPFPENHNTPFSLQLQTSCDWRFWKSGFPVSVNFTWDPRTTQVSFSWSGGYPGSGNPVSGQLVHSDATGFPPGSSLLIECVNLFSVQVELKNVYLNGVKKLCNILLKAGTLSSQWMGLSGLDSSQFANGFILTADVVFSGIGGSLPKIDNHFFGGAFCLIEIERNCWKKPHHH